MARRRTGGYSFRMSVETHTGFTAAVDALKAAGELRAWSLIVTVFGDLASEDGDALSGRALSEILAPLGFSAATLRVAIHRLRKDGWLASEKAGQGSQHRLTAMGRAESLAARSMIYDPPAADGWRLLVPPPAPQTEQARMRAELAAAGWRPLGGAGAMIGFRAGAAAPPGALVACSSGGPPPDWVAASIEPGDLAKSFVALEAALSQAAAALGDGRDLTGVEVATLRTLIVHLWRRLALKDSGAPDALHRPGWRGPACRRLTHRLLARLTRPAPDALNQRGR